jgi:thiamine biosynthesis lipoprotein
MGTQYTIKVVGNLDAVQRGEITVAINERLEAINDAMSTYRPDSELSRFNRYSGQEPFPLSAEVLTVMATAQRLSAESDGAFDMTVGPLVNAWGFGPGGLPPDPPAAAQLEELQQWVGHDKVQLLADGATKTDPRVYCDLSAVAKGYAVDQVADLLEAEGYDRYMVEIGGEVRTAGHNGHDEPWRIGIERPQTSGRGLQQIVPLVGKAMATSGDYRNYYEVEGHRYSHTIDPRTGRPVEHSGAAVSVVADLCLEADGLATTLLVLGPDEGYAFAETRGLAALFLSYDGTGGVTEHATPAFAALLPEALQ